MSRFYVTTPIYYVNSLPHVGHIYTTVVADTLARYHRLAGDEVYFLTGTDEHGQNIERAAAREGIPPLQLADRVVARYHELWREIGVAPDDFIRTPEPRHYRGVEAMIRRIAANDDLYLARHEGWYCSPCETYYTEKELVGDKRCPIHDLPVEWKEEENVFFRLSRYQQALLDWYDDPSEPVRPRTRANEVRSFVEGGLKDLSVSRANLSWGIPFPGYPGHTVYVWLDALSNYLSALGFGRDAEDGLYDRFWTGGDTRLHLIGKDILRHHAVYWPAFLLSAGLPLPTQVWAHGFWLKDQRKISKSAENVARPDHLVAQFGPDPLRYFLLREMVFGQDASFSDEAFVDRYNSDLANDLGNTVSRLVTLSRKAFAGRTPPEACGDNPVLAVAAQAVADYRKAMEELAFSRALEALWRLLAEANQYLVSREPWKLIGREDERSRLSRVLWNGLEAVRIVATGLLPVMPQVAARVLAAIAAPPAEPSLDQLAWGGLATDRELPPPSALFPRIDKAAFLAPPAAQEPGEAAQKEAQPMIAIDQFMEVQLKVGTVVAAEAVPKSQKLLRLTIELGEEQPRTVVAGIAQQYGPEAMQGRQVVVVANLQPAKLMGIESQGMVLAASPGDGAVLLAPLQPVPNGTRVR